eukprot:6194305-Pleurochrysis_carterae.AAC.1
MQCTFCRFVLPFRTPHLHSNVALLVLFPSSPSNLPSCTKERALVHAGSPGFRPDSFFDSALLPPFLPPVRHIRASLLAMIGPFQWVSLFGSDFPMRSTVNSMGFPQLFLFRLSEHAPYLSAKEGIRLMHGALSGEEEVAVMCALVRTPQADELALGNLGQEELVRESLQVSTDTSSPCSQQAKTLLFSASAFSTNQAKASAAVAVNQHLEQFLQSSPVKQDREGAP